MVHKSIKNIWKQPQPDQCIPTAIKTALDNQFQNLHVPSLRSIGSMCEYRNAYGAPVDRLKVNLKKLESYGILFNEKEGVNIEFLKNLLKKGIFPLVLFHLRDYNKWKRGSIEIQADDEMDFHMVIVTGIAELSQEIEVFDTIHDKYKNYKKEEKYNTIKYQQFYTLWTNDDLVYPVYWFTEMVSKGKKDKKLSVFE